jgi:hypothetical protein
MVATDKELIGVHLVGSVPLQSAEGVFRTASRILGGRLRRLPDGETGVRRNWIGWQFAVFQNHPDFEIAPVPPNEYAPSPRFKLRDSVSAATLTFDNLGYADAAKESYATFTRFKSKGVIPAHYRFQVSLPTPLASIVAFIAPECQVAVLPAYRARMLAELADITRAIPHDQLAIQWDVAVEFAVLEGLWPTPAARGESEIIEQNVALGNAVLEDVELGYHLCYGDAGHKHFKEPDDTSKLVAIANGVSAGLTRPVNFIHMPVPRSRADEAYFAPLQNLKLHPETEVYLGLVHLTDGVEGTQRRIEATRKVVQHFGVGTECGMGRRPPETIASLLEVHAAVV